jgi:hypothetical protein
MRKMGRCRGPQLFINVNYFSFVILFYGIFYFRLYTIAAFSYTHAAFIVSNETKLSAMLPAAESLISLK